MNKNSFFLRLALAFPLLFAGIDSFLHPNDWIWFVPDWVTNFGLTSSFALHSHAVVEITLGLLLLLGWRLRWVAAIVAADMAVIILAGGLSRELFLVTFRDVGLLLVAIHLALKPEQN